VNLGETAEEVVENGKSFGTFLSEHREVLVVIPLRILLIVVLAIVIRWLVHRAISRAVRSTAVSDVPVVLRPLKERIGTAALENAGLINERRRQRAQTVGSLLRSIASAVIGVLALMLVLGEVGFQLGPFIAGAGIVGVALGFGAQNLVKDFLSGIFMILEDQYGVGDVVDLGSATGTVESVGLRVTRVRDGNGTLWYARNGEVLRVGNHSQGFAQVTVDLPVPYGSDVDAAGDAMQSVADELVTEQEFADAILEGPKLLGVEKIEADTITLRLTIKVRPAEQWRVARALRQRIADRLDEDGIRPPSTSLDVHTEPARATPGAGAVVGAGSSPDGATALGGATGPAGATGPGRATSPGGMTVSGRPQPPADGNGGQPATGPLDSDRNPT
jgi:moderate conductance mechanosensitive channel